MEMNEFKEQYKEELEIIKEIQVLKQKTDLFNMEFDDFKKNIEEMVILIKKLENLGMLSLILETSLGNK